MFLNIFVLIQSVLFQSDKRSISVHVQVLCNRVNVNTVRFTVSVVVAVYIGRFMIFRCRVH